ncbi:MAG: phosphate transport system regulatory protein PhoU [Pseudomonadota bacterium]|jgi:phosphate transport system protein|nr:phosphate signaling complex protein PhoU [Agitococcus sp.]MBP8111090.1 phosphate signaling complex protein PhoU [Agitococcus sp.]
MTKEDYGHHISQQFNAELEDVRSHFLAMGGLVEKQVSDAMHALLDADSALAVAVQANDHRINAMETRIDEELVRILARRQPAASDLRMIIAISKSLTDLERIGDEAAKIARYAQALCEEGESPRGYMETRHIGNQVRLMIHDTLDAFARLDVEQAFKVMQADSEIDLEYKTATRALMTYMMEDSRYISRVLNVMWVLRCLERIGDHSRNISEQLIYLVKGADVRHVSYDIIDKKLHG